MYEKQMLSSFCHNRARNGASAVFACLRAGLCRVCRTAQEQHVCTVNVITLFTLRAIYYTQFSNFTALADMK